MELNQIWRACRKIQGAIFRYNFDICADLKQHDPDCTGYVSGERLSSGTFRCSYPIFYVSFMTLTRVYIHIGAGQVSQDGRHVRV